MERESKRRQTEHACARAGLSQPAAAEWSGEDGAQAVKGEDRDDRPQASKGLGPSSDKQEPYVVESQTHHIGHNAIQYVIVLGEGISPEIFGKPFSLFFKLINLFILYPFPPILLLSFRPLPPSTHPSSVSRQKGAGLPWAPEFFFLRNQLNIFLTIPYLLPEIYNHLCAYKGFNFLIFFHKYCGVLFL